MPILPGVLIAEAFAQVSGIIALTAHAQHAGKVVYLMFLSCEEMVCAKAAKYSLGRGATSRRHCASNFRWQESS